MILKYEYISWAKIEKNCLELALKIRKDGYFPQIIISLARGGLILGRMLSDYLKVKKLGFFQLEFYEDLNQPSEGPRLMSEFLVDIKNSDVLLCDDLVDTGVSMEFILGLLKSQENIKNIKTATLHIKPQTKFVPDYFVEELDAWIIYPWERYETINSLQRNYSDQNSFEKFLTNLGMKSELIKKIFELKAYEPHDN